MKHIRRTFLLLFLVLAPRSAAAQACGDNGVPGGMYLVSGSFVFCTGANQATTMQPILPTGLITMILSGTCPAGWTEASALNGMMLRGTLAANADVGTTGGADAITPTGTITAPTFTGDSVVSSAVSAGTPAGTNSTVSFTPAGTNGTVSITPLLNAIAWPVGVPTHTGTAATFAGDLLATHAHELPWQIPSTTTIRQIAVATFGTGTSRAATAVSAAGTANTTSAAVAKSQAITGGTPTGIVTITNQGTNAWPVGVPTVTGAATTVGAEVFTGSSGTIPAETFTGSALGTHTHTTTATGSNSVPTFTGAAFNNRPAYTNVIFCSKN